MASAAESGAPSGSASPTPFEVENIAEWDAGGNPSDAGAGTSAAASASAANPASRPETNRVPSTNTVASSTSSAASYQRPRTINNQVSVFLHKLSRLHLDWHIESSTALVYALRSVGGVNVKLDKTLVQILLPDEECPQPQFVLVEKETVLKTILLDSIVSVHFDKEDTSRRSLRIVYWFDKNRRAGPAPPTPASAPAPSASSSSSPIVVNVASSTAKQFLLHISFCSYLDARDVHQLLNYLVSYGLPDGGASPLFRTVTNEEAQFVVLHCGMIEKKGKLTWSKRYAKLYAGGRMVIYRTEKSHMPVNVLSLMRGEGETPMTVRPIGKDTLSIEFPSVPPPADATPEEMAAAATPDVAYQFRFESQRSRDRWLAAFQTEFDQPLKTLLIRPGGSTPGSSTSAAGPTRNGSSGGGGSARPSAGGSGAVSAASSTPSSPGSSVSSLTTTSSPNTSATPPATAPSAKADAAATKKHHTHASNTSVGMPPEVATASRSAATSLVGSSATQAPAATPAPSSKGSAIPKTPASSSHDEAAYTYYSQLLTLLAAPEVGRLPETEELTIPKDSTCGSVNLAQLIKQAKEKCYMTRTSVATRNAQPTEAQQAAAASAAAAAASFNPATQQRVTVLGLLHKIQEQQLYFGFLSYFRSAYSALLFRTKLPSTSVFQASTPSTSIFKMNKRGTSLQDLDRALYRYHTFVLCSSEQLRQAKLLCIENEGAAANTSSSQIGFAFPGFDSQVFDIGKFAIVSPAQMFLGLDVSFDDNEWFTALKAHSVAKELMQSSADLTHLFESANPEDQNRARALMHSAQLEVLHNIALAAHMRQRWAVEKQRLREGDVIKFQEVLEQFDGSAGREEDEEDDENGSAVHHSPSLSLDEFQYSRNRMQLEQWRDISYVYSPLAPVMINFLRARMDAWPTEHPEFHAILGPPPALPSSDGDAQAPEGKHAKSASVSGVNKNGNSNTVGVLDDDDQDVSLSSMKLASNPMHGDVPIPLSSFAPSRHFLFDCFHYLLFLRLLLDQRKTLLERLENALHVWETKYIKNTSKSKASVKYESIAQLKVQAEDEKKKILNAMNQLPSKEVMEAIVKLQSRLAAQAALAHFLPTRPVVTELPKSVAASIVPDADREARAAEKERRKSLLAQHLTARVAGNNNGNGSNGGPNTPTTPLPPPPPEEEVPEAPLADDEEGAASGGVNETPLPTVPEAPPAEDAATPAAPAAVLV